MKGDNADSVVMMMMVLANTFSMISDNSRNINCDVYSFPQVFREKDNYHYHVTSHVQDKDFPNVLYLSQMIECTPSYSVKRCNFTLSPSFLSALTTIICRLSLFFIVHLLSGLCL